MKEITIRCCEGDPEHNGSCIKNRCPVYRDARDRVESNWPHLATGFGNAYGYPREGNYLAKVRELVQRQKPE